MIYADFEDVIFAVWQSALFGLVMGLFTIALSVVINSIENIVLLPKKIYSASESPAKIKKIFKNKDFFSPSNNKIKGFFFDLLFVLTYGIAFSILLYITTDGVFRLYLLLISLGVTYLFIRFLGNYIRPVVLKIFSWFYSIIAFVFSIIILPLRKVIEKIISLIIILFKKTKIFFKNKVKVIISKRRHKLCKIAKNK